MEYPGSHHRRLLISPLVLHRRSRRLQSALQTAILLATASYIPRLLQSAERITGGFGLDVPR